MLAAGGLANLPSPVETGGQVIIFTFAFASVSAPVA